MNLLFQLNHSVSKSQGTNACFIKWGFLYFMTYEHVLFRNMLVSLEIML